MSNRMMTMVWFLILNGLTATISSQAFLTYPTVDVVMVGELSEHVPRPVWFLWVYKWIALVGATLTPFLLMAYTANELNFFIHALRGKCSEMNAVETNTQRSEPVSVDGVRAVTPILFVLNFTIIAVVVTGAMLWGSSVPILNMSPMSVDTNECRYQVRLTQWSTFTSGILVAYVVAICTAI